jgi:hypothetical protein
MQNTSEFVVPIKSGPAYTLMVMIPIQLVPGGLLMALFIWKTWESYSGLAFIGLAMFVGALILQTVLLGKVARQALQMLRYPPRLSAEGIRLWLFPTSDYVLVPWPRVTAIRTEMKGISLGLFVHVHDPEALAGGNYAKTRKVIRLMRRFRGAPFVYTIESSPGQLHAIDQAVRAYSGGRLMLQN